LDKDLFATDDREEVLKSNVLGDMIEVGLKENYQDYDMYIPVIIKDKEETLNDTVLSIEKLLPCDYKMQQLKNMVPKDSDERFVSEEIKIMTRFGEYRVNGEIFNANSYNEYLQRILAAINVNITKTGDRTTRSLPLMQINNIQLIQAIDKYIRTQLFDEPFDPLADNNWRVLMLAKVGIVQHIMKELSKALYNMQNNIDVEEAVIEKRWFSEIKTLKIRENYSLDIQKSIYTKTGYPSNKGGFEKDFLLACDADSEIERLIKINENKHVFTRMRYVRSDGMLSSYFPDFMIKTADTIYLVETKAEKDISNINVQAKQRSALDWVAKINELQPDHRMNAFWKYVLLDDTTFYTLQAQNASVNEILEKYVLIRNVIEGRLF
jgi:type III restriction enzyme